MEVWFGKREKRRWQKDLTRDPIVAYVWRCAKIGRWDMLEGLTYPKRLWRPRFGAWMKYMTNPETSEDLEAKAVMDLNRYLDWTPKEYRGKKECFKRLDYMMREAVILKAMR
jgi:hypothetical protein